MPNRFGSIAAAFSALALLAAGTIFALNPDDTQPARVNELLENPGFEGGYSDLAPGWLENTWGDGAEREYSRSDNSSHGEQSSQKLTVTSNGSGAVQFYQPFWAEARSDYAASIWLRSDSAMEVRVLLRLVGEPYTSLGVRTIKVGDEWSESIVRGGTALAGEVGLFVEVITPGTLYVDDAALWQSQSQIGTTESFEVPATLLGLTLNHQVNYAPAYPTDGGATVGLIRLHDTGLRWNEIEPNRGDFRWDEFDRQVDEAESRGIEVMYTMGLTPRWASSRPDEEGLYGASNLGTSAEPADHDDWIAYVDAVSKRYAGRIQYYEVWNEVDIEGMYSGSVDEMVELSKLAFETIKNNDPESVVLSPNFTQAGVSSFEDYLNSGLDDYVDGYGVHLYSAANAQSSSLLDIATPEGHIHTVRQFEAVLDSYGTEKPIWITEGAVQSSPDAEVSDDELTGAMARAFLVPLMSGNQTFVWYTWEGIVPDEVVMFDSAASEVLPAGDSFGILGDWLAGGNLTSAEVSRDGIYTILLENKAGSFMIIWNPEAASNSFDFTTPEGATWVSGLDGSRVAANGPTISIGPSPVLVELDQ